jgi:hypothetical protein
MKRIDVVVHDDDYDDIDVVGGGRGRDVVGETTPLLLHGSGGGAATNDNATITTTRPTSIVLTKEEIDAGNRLLNAIAFRRRRQTARNAIVQSISPFPASSSSTWTTSHPIEGLMPLASATDYHFFGVGGREASIVKSLPMKAPYRRMARHRSFYLWWTNVSCMICNAWLWFLVRSMSGWVFLSLNLRFLG